MPTVINKKGDLMISWLFPIILWSTVISSSWKLFKYHFLWNPQEYMPEICDYFELLKLEGTKLLNWL